MYFKKGKSIIKQFLGLFGYKLIRVDKQPAYTLLGLRNIPFRTIIDVGANRGQFAKRVLDIFPDAKIFSFEPLPEQFEVLSEWAENKTEGRLKVFNIALGDKRETLPFFEHKYSPSSSFLKTTELCKHYYPRTEDQSLIEVDVVPLDDFMSENKIELLSPVLIKLDVQGFENKVIRGGWETIARSEACVVEVSLEQLYEGQSKFSEIVEQFSELDFCYLGNLNQVYDKTGHVIYIDAVFLKKNTNE
jgi:FkbM family methyltransferase